MRKSIQLICLASIIVTSLLSGCASLSTSVSLTNTPSPIVTPTIVPVNTNPIVISGFQFQISTITLDDTVKMFESYGADTTGDTPGPNFTTHKNGLTHSSNGEIPVNATGDAVLILYLKLISGDKAKFIDFDPQIIEEGITKSAVEVVTQNNGVGFFWIYDVKKSSNSLFLLKLPNQTILDLQSSLRLNQTSVQSP